MVFVFVWAVVGLVLLYWASQFCLMYYSYVYYKKKDGPNNNNYIYGSTVVGVVTARGYVALPRMERMPCIREEEEGERDVERGVLSS